MMPDAQRKAYNRMAVENYRMEKELQAAPDWHRRPTCPGRWLTRDGDFETSAKWKQDDIDYCERVGYHHRLYYGPIPDPPEEVR